MILYASYQIDTLLDGVVGFFRPPTLDAAHRLHSPTFFRSEHPRMGWIQGCISYLDPQIDEAVPYVLLHGLIFE